MPHDDSDDRARTIRIGQSRPRREYIETLHEAWCEKRLVLVLGAGLSIPYGIPSWRDLVMELLLENEERLDKFWIEYKRPLADWMSNEYDFDLLALSRVVKYNIATDHREPKKQAHLSFATRVRKKLYASPNVPTEPTALTTLAELIASAKVNEGIAAIVTMNFDDLLEQKLREKEVCHHSVVDAGAQRQQGLSILHPHGFLPRHGDLAPSSLVFSEDEYHQLVHTPFHWGISELLTMLRRFTTLFVGLSMSDQTLRRLLDETALRDANREPIKPLRRYVLRQDYKAPEGDDLQRASQQIEGEAAKLREQSGNADHEKLQIGMANAIGKMTKLAHAFDRRLFKDMGVGTVWYKGHDDIPAILKAIANGI